MTASLLLSACGGGDGGDNTPPARNTGSISGNVFDAPVNGAQIEVFEYKDGKLGRKLGNTTSDAFGDYKLEFESSSMPLYVVAQQGSYTDPLTKEIVSSSAGKTLRLEGVVNFSEGNDQKLMLTPLTNIVSGLAKYKISGGESGSDAVSEALDSINGMYGFNVNETTPIDITKGGQSSFATPGHQYGALLTAYSSYSYDLIEKYGQSEDNVYTSMHFADIQFRDVIADGLLDGLEISESTGAVTPLTFGQQKITSDVYTQDLSQHVLIVVNDPTLNVSGTDADDYVSFSQKINGLGTNGETDGVIPPRNDTDIDTTPPTVTRTDSDVLAGTDNVDIRLNDDIGVQSVSAYVEYQLNGSWSDEFKCNDQQTSGSEFCSVDASGFEIGVRETNIKVSINTKAIDAVEVNPDTGLSNVTAARLVFYTADVLGNELVPGSNTGHYVNFDWDNDAPVISVTSASAINNQLKEYVLKGIVKEASQDIKSVSVSFKSGLPEDVACSPVTVASGSACEFSKAYSTDEFLSTTTFDIKATDTKDNVGELQHAVSRDDQAPVQVIGYPEGTSMNYVNVNLAGERTTYEGVYTQDTYTADNVQSSRDYLKIGYVYASVGLQSIDGVDFANFNVNLLKENKIPYVRVRVADVNSETVLGSSADKLKLVVKYYVSQNNDDNYGLQKTTDTLASTDTITASIPHETILDSDGRVDEVIYYVPFVKEILGDGFKNVSENASQKLVIQTIDESDNESATQEVYFRSSFDLPTMTVVTPFIGARVQLEGLNPNGEFTSLASCTTIQQSESDKTTALDVASCETTTDVVNYDFMRVRLIGVEGTDPHYYQWKDDEGAKASVNLNNANIGAYFELDGSNTYYVTELATYQTGLFDYRWNQVEAGEKTSEKALQILTDVKYALAGGNDSFFGFDPTVTAYATNEMLEETIPNDLSNDYLHRFLVEAIDDLAQGTPRNNSSDFASAIYDDLSYDGKANGIGAGGNQIKLDDYKFSSNTYRNDLAQSYYNIMTDKYGIPDNLAQLYADDISQADPKLGEDDIIDGEGGSIDDKAPEQTLTIVTGRETMVGNKRYVAGEVVSKVVLEDPSGIVEEGDNAPNFQSMWYAESDPNTAIPLDLRLEESGESNKFKKEYLFSLNTESTDLTDIIEFALETSAFDTKGNGYTEADPLVERLYVDNDYPEASYSPPKDINDEEIQEGVYLSVKNNIHDLTFELDDVVGDKLDKRSLLFYKSSGEKYPVSYEQFYANQTKKFVVRLCSQEDCSAQGTTINPGDGNWIAVVSAEDNLGNSVSDADNGAPRFRIYIDSEAPVVNDAEITERLGGNSVWTPVIDWGELSQGNNVKVELRKGSGQTQTLESCDPATSTCDEPYLIGDQPDVKVQLVAEAFSYDAINEFYVTAADKAYPVNESRKGTFSFKVDNKGPIILLSTPWIEDALTKESTVVGRKFNVLLESVTDDSDITEVSLFQVDNPEALKTFKPTDPSQKFSIPLIVSDTDKIELSGEGNSVSLYVKAKDVHGFERESNINSVIFDKQGPSFSLVGHDVNSYYIGDYVFELRAVDLGSNGSVSTEGVDRENLKYLIFEGDAPPPSEVEKGIVNDEALKIPLGGEDDGEHTIRVKGHDLRGNTSEEDFRFNVSNKLPLLDLTIAYADSGEPIDRVVYNEGNIKLTLKVTDVSGVKRIDSTYKYSSESEGTNFSFRQAGAEDTWEAILREDQLKADGNYELSISVYNNVQYNSDDEPLVSKINHTLSVQRNGVALDIVGPTEDFQNYVSNGVLDVTFKTLSEVKADKIQCWVRQEHSGNDAPPIDEKPTSGEKNISSGQEPSCTVDSENVSFSPAVLIVQTKGTNGAVAVQKFDFKMMDAGSPAVVRPESNTYQFSGGEVTYDLDDPTKYLAFDLIFEDELSGVNITDQENYPKLIRTAGSIPFSAESCVLNAKGEAVCRYKEKYADIIQKAAVKHAYKISNITDNAGNLAADHEFEFLLPTEDPVVDITNPKEGQVLNGKFLNVDFRVKLAENSDLENVSVTFGGESYDLKNNADNFRNFTTCSDDPKYRCSTFHSDELDAGLENKALTIEVLATDVWENRGTDLVEDIRFDNTDPIIGDSITVTEQPSDKVRFTFDEMRDEVSGLARVKYTVRVLDFEEEKTENVTYFELSKDQLLGRDEIKVEVIAVDAVDNSSDDIKTIDLRLPTVALTFDGMTSLQGGKLAFTKESQSFTITSTEGEHVKASHYSIDMVPSSGDTLNFNGNIVLSTGSDTMVFDVDDQAEYMYKVTVIDSIGRSVKDFELFSETYDAKGIESVIDYELPVISGVTANQISMTPADDKYYLDVTAYVADKNLSSVTSTADNGAGFTVGPQFITKPANAGDPYVMHYLLSPGDYTIKVVASDLVNNQAEETITPTVDAATVPELTISTTAPTLLAGGVEVPLTFTFTEEVTEFDISDVKLEASDGGEIGELNPLSWSTTDNITWTVKYITPEKENKDVTIRVVDDSYKSINTIPGKGDSLLLEVEGVLPTLTKVTFDPTHQDIGKPVDVKLEFDKELQEATATLGSNDITSLAVTADKKVWIGTVNVPNVPELSVGLVVSQYKDLVGNVGEENTSNELPITPTLAITPVGNVDGSNAASLQVAGNSTRFDGQTLSVEIKAQGSETVIASGNATVQSGGAWTSSAMDISGQPNGTYTAVVKGTNASNVEATQTTTFTLSQALPTLTSATFNPTHQAEGQSVAVRLEFDKELQAASAELGGSAVTLTKTADASIWTGDVVVPVSSELTVGLVVKDYLDLSGNTGAQDSTYSMPITPTLAITPVGNVDGSNAASLQVAGTSTRFDDQTLSVEIKAQGSETVIASGNATVQSGGAWTSSAMDISGQPNGKYTVVVTGTNASNVEVTETSSFMLSQALPTLTSATFNPTHQAEGQSVAVRLEFDKELQAASAELGGSAVVLTKTVDASIWTGDVVVPATSELTVGLVVKDYLDLSGNTGAQDSTYSMPITPTLAITPVGNVDGSNAASLQVAGTSTRFDDQTLSVEIKAQGSETVIASGNATVQSGGAWTSDAMDISGQPNGTYTVVVKGTNASNVEATETSTLTLSQALPTLTSASFNPTHQAEGQSVAVRLEFDKELQAASAELGGSAVTLTKTADAKVWTGDVVVPVSSELTVGLVVKDYQDLSGNTGAQDSTHSMPITPTLAITPVGNVDGSNAASLQIAGTSTRFDGQTLSVEIKAQGSETVIASGNATVQSGGAWTSSAMDISGQPNGTYTAVVKGTNASNVEVTEISSFTLAQALPTLTSATFNPTHQAEGQSVAVRLEFDKELQAASAELGGSAVVLTKTVDASIWTGDVVVPATSELTVGLVVKDYQDLSGNTGAQDSTHSMPITPTLAITPVGNVDGSNAASLQVAGTSTRFDGQTLSVEIKAQGSETVIASGNATVQSGGAWTSDAMDISGQPNGKYTAVVKGTNASNVEAIDTATFTLAQALPTLTSATFNPTHQAVGDSVAVRLEFDKELQAASAELGGSAVTLTKTADASIWTGDVVVPATSELTVGLVVKDYQDLSGNTGAQDSTHSMPITPTLAITPVGNVDGNNAASLQIAGTSTRFDDQTLSVEIKAQGSETVIASGNATVQSGGAWTSDAMDISGQPNGKYTAVVKGINASNVEATQTTTFTLSQALPTLTSATFNPTHQAEGQSVAVRLEFDKELQAASAELGGSAVTLTKTADASIWTGDVVVPATSELTVGLVVKDYQDLSGNTGAQDSTHSMPITPTILLGTINDVTGSTSVTVNGTSTRFEVDDTIELKAVDTDGTEITGSATVLSGGAWTTDLDLSMMKDGSITVYANGTNVLSASAEQAQATFNYDSTVTALIRPGYWERYSGNLTLDKAA
ncbi:tandem large repeat [Vibrio hyugaensis]|uniref:tandem large repeat n=1 Tax=Vibrio hyugaensis TaxID=1534743 RepID=UPI0005EECAAB|nr:tandem large repeat [Vibrio hyugaensis]